MNPFNVMRMKEIMDDYEEKRLSKKDLKEKEALKWNNIVKTPEKKESSSPIEPPKVPKKKREDFFSFQGTPKQLFFNNEKSIEGTNDILYEEAEMERVYEIFNKGFIDTEDP